MAFAAAEGYLALGMCEDANSELEEIDPFCRRLPEVLTLRLGIYLRTKRWEMAQVVAKQRLRRDQRGVAARAACQRIIAPTSFSNRPSS